MRLRLVFACAFAITACALFTDLDDLSGDGGSASDVMDVSAPDAPSSDSAPTTYCSTQDATFCEDFDEPDAGYLSRWSTITLAIGNSLTTQSTTVTSAPNALVVEVPSGNTGGAALRQELPSSAIVYDFAFAVRFEPFDAGPGSVAWAQIEVDNSVDASVDASVFTEYRFVTSANATNFEAHVYYPDGGNTLATLPLSMTFQSGKWYHVDEQLTLSPPAAKIQIIVDNTPIISTKIAEATNGTGSTSFLAGIYHANPPTGTWRIELDDVVLRAE